MLLKSYLKNISKFPKLTKKEEKILFSKIKDGNEDAKRTVICANLKLVVNIAKRYICESFSIIDLIQEGNIGLIEAIDKFDVNMDTKFDTYAVWHIRRTIIRAFGNKSRTIRVPVHVFEKYQKIRKIIEKLSLNIKYDEDIKKLSSISGFSIIKLKSILSTFNNDIYSLDVVLGNEDSSEFLVNTIEDKNSPSPYNLMFQKERLKEIENVLNVLNERENRIVSLYYGINMDRGYTYKELSELFNLTKERIRQIKLLALNKIKSSSQSIYLRDLQAA